jgi:hypothetical protein
VEEIFLFLFESGSIPQKAEKSKGNAGAGIFARAAKLREFFLALSEPFVVLLVNWSNYYWERTAFEQGWGYLAFPLPPLLSPVFYSLP